MDMFDTFDPFGNRSYGGKKPFIGQAVHKVVRRASECLPADVKDEKRRQSRCQRVHYPDTEKSAGYAYKCGNRSYCIFSVILGNGKKRRAFDGTSRLNRVAVEPFL